MNRDWRDFAKHIVDGIERISDYRQRVETGRADEDIAFDAILRILETIAEAASDKIPEAVKQRHPHINWKAISGMRIRLAHAYLSIDPAVVETTITVDLAELCRAMEGEISDWKRGNEG